MSFLIPKGTKVQTLAPSQSAWIDIETTTDHIFDISLSGISKIAISLPFNVFAKHNMRDGKIWYLRVENHNIIFY